MLGQQELGKLNSFQMRGIRKILRMKSTFIERANTNVRVLEEANRHIQVGRLQKQIKMFSETYAEGRRKSCARILQKRVSDPIRYAALEPSAQIWDFPTKRIRRPRDKWIAFGLSELWQNVRNEHSDTHHANLEFNVNPLFNHVNLLKATNKPNNINNFKG